MELFKIPQSWAVDAEFIAKYPSGVTLSFGGSILKDCSYRSTGLTAAWSLIGALASLQFPLLFQISPGLGVVGLLGGFQDGQFCVFAPARKHVAVYTSFPLAAEGEEQITIRDERFGTFYWIPASAMIPFEEAVNVGTAVLAENGKYSTTVIGQAYANWPMERYSSTNAQE